MIKESKQITSIYKYDITIKSVATWLKTFPPALHLATQERGEVVFWWLRDTLRDGKAEADFLEIRCSRDSPIAT